MVCFCLCLFLFCLFVCFWNGGELLLTNLYYYILNVTLLLVIKHFTHSSFNIGHMSIIF